MLRMVTRKMKANVMPFKRDKAEQENKNNYLLCSKMIIQIHVIYDAVNY